MPLDAFVAFTEQFPAFVKVPRESSGVRSLPRPTLSPRHGPLIKRLQRRSKRGAGRSQLVRFIRRLSDKASFGDLSEPNVQHARRHITAALAQGPGAQRPIAKLPQNPQRPPTSEEIHGCHDRPTRCGSPNCPCSCGLFVGRHRATLEGVLIFETRVCIVFLK